MSVSTARAMLKRGFDRILTTYNSCGLPDVITLNATMGGDTTRRAGGSGAGDGFNTMGFGSIDDDTLGLTTGYQSNGTRTEADVRINSISYNMVTTITSTCGHSVHMPSVMVHEVGHVYGLQHTYAGGQTMYRTFPRCRDYWETLGSGDVAALDAGY